MEGATGRAVTVCHESRGAMSSGRGAAVKQKSRVRHSALRSNHSVEEKIMLKKKFFAKALAFAMATGLLAAEPFGAAVPVQVMAQVGDVTVNGTEVTVEGENGATTTVKFERTAKGTISVTVNGDVSVYYKLGADGSWTQLANSTTIPVVEADQDGEVVINVASDNSGTGAKTVTVPAFAETETPPAPAGALGINIDYEKYTATLSGEKYMFLEVLKKDSKTNGYKTSATYSYTADSSNQVIVDLSFLKGSAENYIRVYGRENEEPTEVKTIAKQPDKSAIKYVPGKTTLADSFTLKKGKATAAAFTEAQLALYSYRSLNGTYWDSLSGLDIENFSVAGTTIIVREDATETVPAGVEAKVKISANPKAPKVAIDYVKNTISMPKDSYYRIITDSVDKEEVWAALPSGGKKSPAELAKTYANGVTEAQIEEGFTLVVYTQKSGKAASNPAFVAVSKAPQIEESAEGVITVVGETGDKARKLTMKVTGEGKDAKATFTAENGDFSITVGSDKPKTVKSGKAVAVKQTDAAQSVKIQMTGVKPVTRGTPVPGSFPSSNTVPLTIPAKSASETPDQTKKATLTVDVDKTSVEAPAAGAADAVVVVSHTAKDADGKDAEATEVTYKITYPTGADETKVVFDTTAGKENNLQVKAGAAAGTYKITVTAKVGTEAVTGETEIEVTASAP